jgi:hypothetical protein
MSAKRTGDQHQERQNNADAAKLVNNNVEKRQPFLGARPFYSHRSNQASQAREQKESETKKKSLAT